MTFSSAAVRDARETAVHVAPVRDERRRVSMRSDDVQRAVDEARDTARVGSGIRS